MATIEFTNVCVDFPIYNGKSRSLKTKLAQIATGGRLGSDRQGRIIVKAIDNLSFSFKNGDRVGLLGHNGAGKSTLLRLLGGVYEPSSGIARIEGTLGSLIDISLGIDQEATGRQNIYFRGCLLGMSKSEINQQIDNIIDFSELGNFIDMPLRTYSSGMHLRLAFSVATVLRPEILLMDEWLSVGDEGFKHKAEQRMSELVQSTNILVIASHSLEIIQNTCNRVIWLKHGKLQMDGEPSLVVSNYLKQASCE
jgi:lipopolysaccharide transport system ATP-binding protein